MKIIFDLDGTLSDATARGKKYLIDPPKKDWNGFNADACNDPGIPQTLQIYKDLILQGHQVEIWTGRCDSTRDDTIKWLLDRIGSKFVLGRTLRMRPVGDHRHDDVIKKEWADQFGKPDAVFEDRQRVVNMWRSIGVVCYQVAPGDF